MKELLELLAILIIIWMIIIGSTMYTAEVVTTNEKEFVKAHKGFVVVNQIGFLGITTIQKDSVRVKILCDDIFNLHYPIGDTL